MKFSLEEDITLILIRISMNTKSIIKDSFQFADVLKSKDFIFDIFGNKVIPYFG